MDCGKEGRTSYWSEKEMQSERAQRWVWRLERKYQGGIDHSIANAERVTARKDRGNVATVPPANKPTLLMNMTTEDCIRMCIRGCVGQRILALNFASFKNPGGGFLQGSSAQEESLCHATSLYPVLNGCKEFYSNHKESSMNRKAVYTTDGIYTPYILVFDDENLVGSCDIITLAAPNYRVARFRQNVDHQTLVHAMQERVYTVFREAQAHEVDVLILGAYGCGVFGWNPKIVAGIMKDAQEIFQPIASFQTIYAIPDNGEIKSNFRAFMEVLARGKE